LGYAFLESLLCRDGHFAGEYGGPMFLMPGLIIACHMTGVDLGMACRVEMIRYLRNQQRADGGWGLHVEGESTVLGTATNYVSIRLLGVAEEDRACVEAREFLHRHGQV
jgi:prenyltransferase beta subunit